LYREEITNNDHSFNDEKQQEAIVAMASYMEEVKIIWSMIIWL
jgi:hypothetical protein